MRTCFKKNARLRTTPNKHETIHYKTHQKNKVIVSTNTDNSFSIATYLQNPELNCNYIQSEWWRWRTSTYNQLFYAPLLWFHSFSEVFLLTVVPFFLDPGLFWIYSGIIIGLTGSEKKYILQLALPFFPHIERVDISYHVQCQFPCKSHTKLSPGVTEGTECRS